MSNEQRTMWVIEIWGDGGGWTTLIDQIGTEADATESLAGMIAHGQLPALGARVSEYPWED